MSDIKNAGGTSGGSLTFFIGLIMMMAGGYLFLNSVTVNMGNFMRYSYGGLWGIQFRTGMMFIPATFGFGMVFFNSKNWLGWILLLATAVFIVYGMIASAHVSLNRMTSFDLLMILGLLFGGIGLFLKSLRPVQSK